MIGTWLILWQIWLVITYTWFVNQSLSNSCMFRPGSMLKEYYSCKIYIFCMFSSFYFYHFIWKMFFGVPLIYLMVKQINKLWMCFFFSFLCLHSLFTCITHLKQIIPKKLLVFHIFLAKGKNVNKELSCWLSY